MRLMAILVTTWLLVLTAPAQDPYNSSPDWVSSDTPYSTGAALVDLDLDGWPDLVVSNGNDMRRERVVVYYNNGDGTFPSAPDWQSATDAYHGHLDVADVNGDGWPDVAVSLLLNEGGPAAKLFLNNNGTLSTTPDWTSAEAERAFGVAFGDVNNDGRPDLAVATGWGYNPGFEAPSTVHLNINGQLEQVASWQSDDENDYMGALWTDADNDGWLDLVGVGCNTHTWIYRNLGGVLETTASWHTTDNAGQNAIMATAGDVTGDGYRELFVTDNTQIFQGDGHFRQYNGLPAGMFTTTPQWYYYDYNHRYGAAVALADIDADGHLDLATGAWWSRSRLFYNDGSGFGSTPDWIANPSSVVEKIVFADIDKNALRNVTETFPTSPGAHLFYLAHQPVQHIVAVHRDGVELTPDQYTFSREHGWVTVGPDTGDVEVEYTCSSRLDMAISNWDDSLGNYVYYNLLVLMGDANCDGRLNAFDIDPFVLLLVDRPQYDLLWPDCDADTFCDMNGDGVINAFDIDGFVAALISP